MPVVITISAALLLLMPFMALAYGLSVAPFFMLFVLLVAIPRHRAFKEALTGVKRHVPLLLLLVLWPLLSSLWSILPTHSLDAAVRMALSLAAALMAVSLLQLQPGSRPERLALALGVALAALALLSEMLPSGGIVTRMVDSLSQDERFMEKNIKRGLCVLSLLAWPAAACLVAEGKRRLAAFVPIFVLIALLSMHSASAKLGWLLGGAVFLAVYYAPRQSQRLLWAAVPLFFLLWPALFFFGEPAIREHLYERLPPSGQHRVEIWHFALQTWLERPLLGWGVDASREVPGAHELARPLMANLPLHPHNLPIQVLLEQGALGFLMFTAALALASRRIFSATHDRAVVALSAATFVSYTAMGCFAFGMWQSWWISSGLLAWMLLALARKRIA